MRKTELTFGHHCQPKSIASATCCKLHHVFCLLACGAEAQDLGLVICSSSDSQNSRTAQILISVYSATNELNAKELKYVVY